MNQPKVSNGMAIVRSHNVNQSTAFSSLVRTKMNLAGLLPEPIESIHQQCTRVFSVLDSLSDPLAKHMYLSRIKSESTTLFYYVFSQYIKAISQIVYTPTINDVCLNFSSLYTPGFSEGLFLTPGMKSDLDGVLSHWPYASPDVAIITDGSQVLGLGDMGLNGMAVAIAKASLYVAAAGISPHRTLPIVVDFGTNNVLLRQDPLYLGSLTGRPSDNTVINFMDTLMHSLKQRWPRMVIHFEGWSADSGMSLLDRYRNKYLAYNDNIQGTASVILSGLINAIEQSGMPLRSHRILVFGAGQVASCLNNLISLYFKESAANVLYFVDSQGLITSDRSDVRSGSIAFHKSKLIRSDISYRDCRDLADAVEYIKPSILIGVSGVKHSFTDRILRKLSAWYDAPIVFALFGECTFAEVMRASGGRGLFIGGNIERDLLHPNGMGTICSPGLGSSIYIYPGIGLGSLIAAVTRVSDDMILAAIHALACARSFEEKDNGLIYPRLERVKEASVLIAREVIKMAVKESVARDATALEILRDTRKTQTVKDYLLISYIKKRMYEAKYLDDDVILKGGLKALI